MLSALALFMVTSCSKSKDEPVQEQSKSCKQTETKFSDGTVFQYTYDDKGRVVTWKQIWSGGSTTETITYQYSANEIVETEKGDYTNVTKHTLNASGNITSSSTTSGYDSSVSATTYTYDANGYLIQIKNGNLSPLTLHYTNGNLTSINNQQVTYTITYGADTYSGGFFRYNTNDTFPEEIETPLFSYYGKRSKSLPTKAVVNWGRTETTESYTYEKDAIGNITKFVNNAMNGNASYVNTMQYTYGCN